MVYYDKGDLNKAIADYTGAFEPIPKPPMPCEVVVVPTTRKELG